MTRAYVEDVTVGEELPPVVKRPTRVSIFMFGVAYWTAHRIHWDKDWAQSEGYPDVLVTAPLATSYMSQMLVNWAGDPGCVRMLSTTYRALMHPGDTLTARGIIRKTSRDNGENLVEVDVYLENQDGVKPIVGNAVLSLPSKMGG